MGVLLTTPVLGKEGGREARGSVKNRHRQSRHHGHTDTRTDIDTHTQQAHRTWRQVYSLTDRQTYTDWWGQRLKILTSRSY